MTQYRMDRRVARTRAKLQNAHLSLILKRDYETVTVEDICGAARVGRSTFYAHYAGKDDLKRGGLEALRNQLIEEQRQAFAKAPYAVPHFAFSLPLFEHAREHLALYRALAGGRGANVALGSIRDMLRDLVREELSAIAAPLAGDSRAFAIEYIVGAYMALLTSWLDGGAQAPPNELDALFRRLAREGLRGGSSHSVSEPQI